MSTAISTRLATRTTFVSTPMDLALLSPAVMTVTLSASSISRSEQTTTPTATMPMLSHLPLPTVPTFQV